MIGTPRDEFLARVRRATAHRIPPHSHDDHPVDGEPGRLVGRDESLAVRYVAEATAAGMRVHRAADLSAAREIVSSIIRDAQTNRVLLWPDQDIQALDLAGALAGDGITVDTWDSSAPSDERKSGAFAMACGVTGVDYAVAETGSLVVCSSPEHGRSVSLLGSVHIALARERQLVPDLYDLFPRVHAEHPDLLPSNVTLITGPSKTADIELQLVVGVHGPGVVHVILVP